MKSLSAITNNEDITTKKYVDDADNLKVDKSSVVQTLSTGTKIGEVNGTEFFAPSGGGGSSIVFDNFNYDGSVSVASGDMDLISLTNASALSPATVVIASINLVVEYDNSPGLESVGFIAHAENGMSLMMDLGYATLTPDANSLGLAITSIPISYKLTAGDEITVEILNNSSVDIVVNATIQGLAIEL